MAELRIGTSLRNRKGAWNCSRRLGLFLTATGAGVFWQPIAFYTSLQSQEARPVDPDYLPEKVEIKARWQSIVQPKSDYAAEDRFLRFVVTTEIFSTAYDVLDGSEDPLIEQLKQVRVAWQGRDDASFYPYAAGPSKLMVLSGTPENLREGLRHVIQAAYLCDPDRDRSWIFVLPSWVKAQILGDEGAKLRETEQRTATNISFGGPAAPSEMHLTVSGSAEGLEQVAAWLIDEQESHVDVMRLLRKPCYSGGLVRSMEAPSSIFLFIDESQIQRFDHDRRRLAQDYSIRIDIENDRRGPEGEVIVNVRGLLGNVHAAQSAIVQEYMEEPSRGDEFVRPTEEREETRRKPEVLRLTEDPYVRPTEVNRAVKFS